MAEYISRKAVFDEIQFQRELAESNDESLIIEVCDAMVHNLKDIKIADVQSTERIHDLIQLLKGCESKFRFLLDTEVDNSSSRYAVKELIRKIQAACEIGGNEA